MIETLGHVYWPRTGERDRFLVDQDDRITMVSGVGFLNKNWQGQYLDTLRDFCRQEEIRLTLGQFPASSEGGQRPAGGRS
jgi:hypothetical protein